MGSTPICQLPIQQMQTMNQLDINSSNQKLHVNSKELHAMVMKGWPVTKDEVPHSICEFWTVQDEQSIYDGNAHKGMRIVVPPSMQTAMLKQIHKSHLGIVKSKQRGKES